MKTWFLLLLTGSLLSCTEVVQSIPKSPAAPDDTGSVVAGDTPSASADAPPPVEDTAEASVPDSLEPDVPLTPDSDAAPDVPDAEDLPDGQVGPEAPCGETTFEYTPVGPVGYVLVAGTFNGWNSDPAQGDVMTDPDGDGTYSVTRVLSPGAHQYKFVHDGTWLADPNNARTAPDGVGGVNSVVDIPECGGVLLSSWTQDGGDVTAVLVSSDGEDFAPDSLSVTVDSEPVSGALTVSGSQATLTLVGLPSGIHDVRVHHPGGLRLLKAYVDVDPDWRDVVLYFAMTDRFVNGDVGNDAPMPGVDVRTNYQGGDFEGIRQKIEDGYFDDLGVGALWISWPIDNPDYAEPGFYPAVTGCGMDPNNVPLAAVDYTGFHGYWPSKVDEIESRFGTRQELRDMVRVAHERGIRILLDFTANHVHDSSPWFEQYAAEGWFNLPAQVCGEVGWEVAPLECWFTPYLPDFDFKNPAARKAVLDEAVALVEDTGADGFRFDAVKHLEMSFVTDLRARTTAEFEGTGVDFYLVGETFSGLAGDLTPYIGDDRLHGQFDFPTNLALLHAFAMGSTPLGDFDAQVRVIDSIYGDALMSRFVGNHDIGRFVSMASGDLSCGPWDITSNIAQGWHAPPPTATDPQAYARLRLALTYVYTVPGVPLVYYGDEVGLAGGGDPDNRRMMIFDDELSMLQQQTLSYVRSLGQVRKQSEALRRGDWKGPLWAEADVLAWSRETDSEAAVVIINRSDASRTLPMLVDLPEGLTLTSVLGGDAQAQVSGNQLVVEVPAQSARIYLGAK